jgi:site-specific DNA-methyltransferase (adenine-specific)
MPISEVFNEDNMIGMARFPDKFFDLAIVDPPYGINATEMNMGSNTTRSRNDGHGSGPAVSTTVKLKGRLNQGSGKLKNRLLNKSDIGWDNAIPGPEYFAELKRVSTHQIIWGGNYFPLPPTRCIVCWDKRQPWENFSQWEMAWTSFDKPAALFSYSNTGGANAEIKIHPTQKPVALYKWLLNKYAKHDCNSKHTKEYNHLCTICKVPLKILDTHMGSQSSRIAAYQMTFDYWGWEIDKDYFEAGDKRFTEQTAQLKLL